MGSTVAVKRQRQKATAKGNGKRQRQKATARGNGKRQRQKATTEGNDKRPQLTRMNSRGQPADGRGCDVQFCSLRARPRFYPWLFIRVSCGSFCLMCRGCSSELWQFLFDVPWLFI
jgi:hypothetical protein